MIAGSYRSVGEWSKQRGSHEPESRTSITIDKQSLKFSKDVTVSTAKRHHLVVETVMVMTIKNLTLITSFVFENNPFVFEDQLALLDEDSAWQR